MVLTPESHFAEFRASGSAVALAAVFDLLAPELLLVAAHLAPRGVEPEDVVQATFLDAIAKAASWDAARPLLPWLIGILVRNAQALGRMANRRPDPARLPRRAAPSTPLDATAASELAAHVASALEGLPRHYRQVLTLHLVHGFSSAQIAHALSCPVATVRTRLHRGLERLRALLPVALAACVTSLFAGRGLAAVRQAVLGEVAALGVPATVTVVGSIGGVLLMTKLLTGVGAALVVAAVWMFWPRAIADSTAPVAGGQAVSLTVAQSAPADVTTAPVADTPESARREPPTRTALAGALRAEFVWVEDAAPADLLDARVVRLEGDRELDARWLQSGRNGILDLPQLTPGRYRVAALEQAGSEVDVVAGEVARLRIVLQPRVDVHGIVVDETDAPVRGAEVRTGGRDEALVLAVTGADGRFRWRGGGLGEIWAQHEGSLPSVLSRSMFEGRVEVRLVLGERGVRVSGAVLDPDDQPVPSALVVISTATRKIEAGLPNEQRRGPIALRSDARGEFTTASLAAGEQLAVAIAEGFGPAMQTVTLPVDGGRLVLRLCRGATVRGIVRQGDAPRQGVLLYATPQPVALRIAPMYSLFWLRTSSDAQGHYELRNLLPGAIRITAQPGDLPAVQHKVALADGQEFEWNPVLTNGLAVRGTVVDENGTPLVGWHVYADVGRPSPLATLSDGAGRFALEGLRPADYRVEVAPPTAAGAATTLPWAYVKTSADTDDVVVRVPALAGSDGYFTGRVMDAAGRVPAKTSVTVYPSFPDETMWTQPVGTDGRFRLGPLRPARYQVHAELPDRTRVNVSPSPTLAAGATVDLGTITFARQVTFTVLLRHADGTLVRDARVVLDATNSGHLTRLADGAWQSKPVPPGPYTLRAWGEAFAIVERRVEVTSDRDPRTDITVDPGTPVRFVLGVPGAGQVAQSASVVFVAYDARQRMVLHSLFEVGGAGPSVVTCGMAAGEYRAQASVMGSKRQVTRSFTVPPEQREPLEVELDLTPPPEGGR